ncbi:PRAME family member 8-like [Pipistrellus kuhlii]|uniref:PRAME family member 8-like n=1 Tax=Pipistrellus kuhlii TaxID=59472 RepID=UPI001E2708E1|nr:PRAME family member 8-like [Pipistrellus kuhlii]
MDAGCLVPYSFPQNSFLSTLKMSMQTPPTLLELAAKRLLRDQASAIAALEHLPAELFPPLFLLAFHSRQHQESLKAMARAWPYPVLHLGGLMRRPRVKVLKAVLDGLDVLLAQEVRPRRCKLRVLDLRNLGADFWRMWCGDSTQKHSSMVPVAVHRSSPNMEHPLAPVEVFLDLNFNERKREEFFMYVIQWAQQREGLVHLCCKTLRIAVVPFQRLRQVLDAVQLDCIQEVEVNCIWDLPTLGTFALYMGQMGNLQKLSLSYIQLLSDEDEDENEDENEEENIEEEEELEEEEEWQREEQEDQEEQEEQEEAEEQASFSQFLSQMLRLQHLRELDMNSPSFLRGRLDQMLRCLQTPLEKFAISHCQRLTHSDLTHLFQCPNLRQLKSLRLYCVSLADFSPEPLRALLEAVAPTLQDLGLDNCAMVDSQIEAILPVLSRCHQLSFFTISENRLSLATVEKLLRHTARLRSLEMELYPVPLECYTTQDTVNQERLDAIQAELTGILRELGQPRSILLVTKHSGYREYYDVAFSCQGACSVPL